MSNKFLIIGTGAWGTALASVLLDNHQYVKMFGISQNQIEDLKKGFNQEFFNNIKLKSPPQEVSTNLKSLIEDVQFIVICVPSNQMENILKKIKPYYKPNMIIINTCKGLDQKTNNNYLKVILNHIKNSKVASLIGPSFAIDVINKVPTVVNVISSNKPTLLKIKKVFDNNYFKVVPIKDIEAASYLSALKNSLAIVCGLLNYADISSNYKYAIMAMGIKEINKFLLFKKLNPQVIFEYCGLGDILLTCNDEKSRNFQFGKSIITKGLDKAISENKNTIEGFKTIEVIYKLIKKNSNQFPLFTLAYQLITKKITTNEFITKLWLNIDKV